MEIYMLAYIISFPGPDIQLIRNPFIYTPKYYMLNMCITLNFGVAMNIVSTLLCCDYSKLPSSI